MFPEPTKYKASKMVETGDICFACLQPFKEYDAVELILSSEPDTHYARHKLVKECGS